MAKASKIKTGTVSVEGLRELNKALRALGPDMQKKLGAASRSVAEFVASDARSAALRLGGVAAKVAPSIKGVGGARSAGVAFGGARYPMAAGAEFGAGQDLHRRRSSGAYLGFNQFEPWRGNGKDAGYFVYPSIRQDADRIVTEYGKAIDDLLKEAFPD